MKCLKQRLKESISEIGYLGEDKLRSIVMFMLMWSYFEYRFLDKDATVDKLRDLPQSIHIDIEELREELQCEINYFKERYNDEYRMRGLFPNGRNYGKRDVENFINSDAAESNVVLSGVLIIIYRLRNNMFHGEKFTNGMEDQEENFDNSVKILEFILRNGQQVGVRRPRPE